MFYITAGLDAPKYDYAFEVKLPFMYESEKESKKDDFVFYMSRLGIAVCKKTQKGKACSNPNLIPFDAEYVTILGVVSESEEYDNLTVFKVERDGGVSLVGKPFDELDADVINSAYKNVKISKKMAEIMDEYRLHGYERPFIQCKLTTVIQRTVDRSFHPAPFIDTDELGLMVDMYKKNLLSKIGKSLK